MLTEPAQVEQMAPLSALVPLRLRNDLVRTAHANDRSISAELRCALKAHLDDTVASTDNPEGEQR